MTQEQVLERQRRDDAYEELSKLARPEVAAAEKKLGDLAKHPVKDGSASVWITLNGRDVDADGNLIDRTKGYVAAVRYIVLAGFAICASGLVVLAVVSLIWNAVWPLLGVTQTVAAYIGSGIGAATALLILVGGMLAWDRWVQS